MSLTLRDVAPRWLSARALGLHLALAVWVAGCAAATWWQVARALSGNTLSYAYVFEWPALAGFGIFVWWRLLHTSPEEAADRSAQRTAAELVELEAAASRRDRDAEDPELAAYNDHLAALTASGRRKSWRR